MKNTQDKIDDFLLNRLSLADRKAFEQELEKNQELANQVKTQREIMGALAVVGREKFKARLQRIKSETIKTPAVQDTKRPSMPAWVWWAIGLLALALIMLMLWRWQSTGEDPNAIYADLFDVYQVPVVQRDTEDQQLIRQLSTYYKEGAYQAFIDGFTPRADKLSAYPELMLSLGISYLKVGQARAAEEVLIDLERGDYPAYHDHARWYRILAALKAGNVEKVKDLLPVLLNDEEADHHKEAKDLARRL